jgi:crotonobetainyl-CoA:carnitine CoA-transferase CaiB-like acyl-CoA transferase
MDVVALVSDPHFSSRGFTIEMEHPETGKLDVTGLPARFSAIPDLAYFHSPLLGQHNDFVFGEVLGHPLERVEELKAAKAIH